MDANGRLTDDMHVLRWPGRILAAEDVRRSLNGPKKVLLSRSAVVTPLAAEELRARGVSFQHLDHSQELETTVPWGQGQERPFPLVESALRMIARDGITLADLPDDHRDQERWAWSVAECIAAGTCRGGVVFCHDPGLVCCVANKVPGIRAVPVISIAQVARATLTMAPNLVAVEMPGRTYFEIRQMIRIVCGCEGTTCPAGVAQVLEELETHAHRGNHRPRHLVATPSHTRRVTVADRGSVQSQGVGERSS